jgi:hypothetical protein
MNAALMFLALRDSAAVAPAPRHRIETAHSLRKFRLSTIGIYIIDTAD